MTMKGLCPECDTFHKSDEACPQAPPICEECGVHLADPPRKICPGCDAYREHTGAI